MKQSEVSQELVWCGLGDWNQPADTIKEYEAYGEGKLSMAYVYPDGTLALRDGYGKDLWKGIPEDGDQICDLLTQFGHYAAC